MAPISGPSEVKRSRGSRASGEPAKARHLMSVWFRRQVQGLSWQLVCRDSQVKCCLVCHELLLMRKIKHWVARTSVLAVIHYSCLFRAGTWNHLCGWYCCWWLFLITMFTSWILRPLVGVLNDQRFSCFDHWPVTFVPRHTVTLWRLI